jgi:hypothetical protein
VKVYSEEVECRFVQLFDGGVEVVGEPLVQLVQVVLQG